MKTIDNQYYYFNYLYFNYISAFKCLAVMHFFYVKILEIPNFPLKKKQINVHKTLFRKGVLQCAG